MPGRFQVSSDGRRVAYVEKISRNRKEADNIFIAESEKIDSAIYYSFRNYLLNANKIKI